MSHINRLQNVFLSAGVEICTKSTCPPFQDYLLTFDETPKQFPESMYYTREVNVPTEVMV